MEQTTLAAYSWLSVFCPSFLPAGRHTPGGTANTLQALGWKPPGEASRAGRTESLCSEWHPWAAAPHRGCHSLFGGNKSPYLFKLVVDLHSVIWRKNPSWSICLLIFLLLTRTVHQKVRLLAGSQGTLGCLLDSFLIPLRVCRLFILATTVYYYRQCEGIWFIHSGFIHWN